MIDLVLRVIMKTETARQGPEEASGKRNRNHCEMTCHQVPQPTLFKLGWDADIEMTHFFVALTFVSFCSEEGC